MAANPVYSGNVVLITSASQLSGANRIMIDTGSPQAVLLPLSILQEYLADTSEGPQFAITSNAATAAAALTGAQISGGSIEVDLSMTGALAGDAALTLPTVAALVAAITAAGFTPFAGQTYKLRILNISSGHTWTITTNTGWTLAGNADTIATATYRDFVVNLTSLTAATLTDIGGGTIV